MFQWDIFLFVFLTNSAFRIVEVLPSSTVLVGRVLIEEIHASDVTIHHVTCDRSAGVDNDWFVRVTRGSKVN